MTRSSLLGLASLVTLAACGSEPAPSAPSLAPSLAVAGGPGITGAVYTTTNAAGANAVLAFDRRQDGTLGDSRMYATGGNGAGAGLGSQGAIVLSADGRWLLAVNAGSDDVSVFRVSAQGLERTDVEPSGGTFPVSVTIRHDVVYVLNGGGINNVTGFRLSAGGDLAPIAGATYALSAAATGPAQAEFSPDGERLVVTEKATNLITTFRVMHDGRLGTRTSVASSTPTPFGFAFDRRGHVIVSEAAGGAAGASDLSSYDVSSGTAVPISASVATTQSAACWVLIPQGTRFAFTTNTASGTISAFAIETDGAITLQHAVAASTGAGSGPIDMAASGNGRFVYALTPGASSVQAFGVNGDGTLAPLGASSGLPATAFGLAAR